MPFFDYIQFKLSLKNTMIFYKVIRYLLAPNKLYKRINKYFQHKNIIKNYNYNLLENEQCLKFRQLELDYERSKIILDKLYIANPELKVEMTSCHHNLFASLSESKKYDFKDILEIGTHSGAGAALLSTLFQNSMVDTIDLPDNHNYVESGSYGLQDNEKRNSFFQKRNELLKGCKNLKFTQMDSSGLTFLYKKYNFIWVDANHEFPYVAVDIANALRLLQPGGLIACDDVRINGDVMKTLEQFYNAGFIDFVLIHKRTVLPENLDLVGKYIAVVKLKP